MINGVKANLDSMVLQSCESVLGQGTMALLGTTVNKSDVYLRQCSKSWSILLQEIIKENNHLGVKSKPVTPQTNFSMHRMRSPISGL